jgi:predicted RNA methylase
MKVSQDVMAVLEAASTDGSSLRLNGQLDRKMYEAVNKALELAGGKWNRSAKAHMFPQDAAEAIEGILLTGEIVDTEREFDAFYTPSDVVDQLIVLADLHTGMTALEPSAGEGAIALRLARAGAIVTTYEVRVVSPWWDDCPTVEPFIADFLTQLPDPTFDRVVMNPPFSRQQDMIHVAHALKFLKPGGVLVSVMSPAFEFRTTSVAKAFRALYDSRDGETIRLPEGSFKASGTMVNSVIVRLTLSRQVC